MCSLTTRWGVAVFLFFFTLYGEVPSQLLELVIKINKDQLFSDLRWGSFSLQRSTSGLFWSISCWKIQQRPISTRLGKAVGREAIHAVSRILHRTWQWTQEFLPCKHPSLFQRGHDATAANKVSKAVRWASPTVSWILHRTWPWAHIHLKSVGLEKLSLSLEQNETETGPHHHGSTTVPKSEHGLRFNLF